MTQCGMASVDFPQSSKYRGCPLNIPKQPIQVFGAPLDESGVWSVKLIAASVAHTIYAYPAWKDTIFDKFSEV